MKIKLSTILVFSLFFVANIQAQDKKVAEKPRMIFMGAYDAGQAGANIYKMFDPTEDVVCYILMPETAGRKAVEGGKWIYDGNNIGSISCLKVKLPVVPLAPAAPQK
jgi:hypothetical protein